MFKVIANHILDNDDGMLADQNINIYRREKIKFSNSSIRNFLAAIVLSTYCYPDA